MSARLTIILPAKNEAASLRELLPRLYAQYADAEILVVDDGSNDDTEALARTEKTQIIKHPYSMGNGAAIKTGARVARGELLVFMDADGQHDPADIPRLLAKLDEGYDMAVGARHYSHHASSSRRWANEAYNRLASFMTGRRIEDLTSGFRAVRAGHFKRFLYLLPNGFSYPTTITMAFLRSGFPVAYVPIEVRKRRGRSHINLLKDGLRFFVIILKIGTLFSPMRLFFPVSAAFFSIGIFYYAYTFINSGRFTNMSALLFISSILIFLIGIVSEQISALHYKGVEADQQPTRRDS